MHVQRGNALCREHGHSRETCGCYLSTRPLCEAIRPDIDEDTEISRRLAVRCTRVSLRCVQSRNRRAAAVVIILLLFFKVSSCTDARLESAA
jgi:hypothetical protein